MTLTTPSIPCLNGIAYNTLGLEPTVPCTLMLSYQKLDIKTGNLSNDGMIFFGSTHAGSEAKMLAFLEEQKYFAVVHATDFGEPTDADVYVWKDSALHYVDNFPVETTHHVNMKALHDVLP